MTQSQPIQIETEKALALLSAATDLINSGRLVSIAALSQMVADICRLAQENGYARCAQFKPLMMRLNEQMDSFSETLKSHYDFAR